MERSGKFSAAFADYLYLLDRNYSSKSALKLVGDKYALPSNERALLYRGVVAESVMEKRARKRLKQFLPGTPVFVDGFNVCRTVGSYLCGNLVFEAMDGFLRDVSELHRKKLKWNILERSVCLLIQFLKENNAGNIQFYFDKPISHSGKMVELFRGIMKESQMKGEAATVFSPDHCLIEVRSGLVCTSDSHIIDQAKVPVFDLAHAVLKANFQADIFSLQKHFKKHRGN